MGLRLRAGRPIQQRFEPLSQSANFRHSGAPIEVRRTYDSGAPVKVLEHFPEAKWMAGWKSSPAQG
jgi:hypothetical protein